MRFMPWLASVLAVAVGASLVAGGRAAGADRPIVRDVELEALQEAVRWPKADVTTVMALTSRFMATRRDADGFAYFQDRAASEPDRALFPALEGLFEARSADEVSVFRRVARVNNALAKLDRARLPFISVLTDPTTGGVTASFAMLGDLNIAEPKALIGFAGPRVIEQTIRQKLPEGFQRSEFLLEHGMLDLIVDRREMKGTIAKALRFMGQIPVEVESPAPSLQTGSP